MADGRIKLQALLILVAGAALCPAMNGHAFQKLLANAGAMEADPSSERPFAHEAPAIAPGTEKSKIPEVSVLRKGAAHKLPIEKTQLAQTKNKPTSMAKLATDTALIQGFQATVNSATSKVTSHVGSGVGGSTMGQAASTFSGLLGQRKPKLTYVWAVAHPASANLLREDVPQFSVNFSSVPGINPEEYEPAIVKLTPAQNSLRLVGATQGKEDAISSSAVDWEMYSGFVEDSVKIQSHKIGPGQYQISPASPLLPGEYGVVFRPVSSKKKFSGGDVSRYQGDGMMFDSVWSFQIPQ